MKDASHNYRGAGLMMAGMAYFTLSDATVKSISDQMPIGQMMFLRGALTSLWIALAMTIWYRGRWRIPPGQGGLIALRVLAEIGAAWFFLTALFHMPIANVTAILQSLPLTVTLAAALFLGEPVGWRRMAAIGAGLIGVLMIIQPSGADFSIHAIYALIAVGFVTCRDIVTRQISPDVPSMSVTLVSALGVVGFFGALSLTEDWAPMAAPVMGWIALSSVLILGGYLFSIMVMRVGEVGFVTPFRYTGVLWALVLGWYMFGD